MRSCISKHRKKQGYNEYYHAKERIENTRCDFGIIHISIQSVYFLFIHVYIYIYIGNTSLEKAWNFPATPGTLELKEFAVAGPLTRISQSWSSDTR